MEITTKIKDWMPLEVVRYITQFLNLCQGCSKHLANNEVLKCNECKRSWCASCQSSPNIIKKRYHPATGQLCYICAWCIREAKEVLG